MRRTGLRHEIEHDERATTEIVTAFEGFAVSPHEAAACELAQRRKRGLETISDGEQRTVPVPHSAGRRVNERSPSVQFWLGIPQAALGRSQLQLSALNRARGIREWRRNVHGL